MDHPVTNLALGGAALSPAVLALLHGFTTTMYAVSVTTGAILGTVGVVRLVRAWLRKE